MKVNPCSRIKMDILDLDQTKIKKDLFPSVEETTSLHNKNFPCLDETIEKKFNYKIFNYVEEIATEVYKVVILLFYKFKGLGVKIGHQFRASILSVSNMTLLSIQVGDVHHHSMSETKKKEQLQIENEPGLKKEEYSQKYNPLYKGEDYYLNQSAKATSFSDKERFPGKGNVLGKV